MLQAAMLPTERKQRGNRASVDGEDEESSTETKLQQLKEMKEMERSYEALLLSQVSFPEAGVVNTEVEAWADQVMQNWRTLCGPAWTDVMRPKEKETSGRNVLAVSCLLLTPKTHRLTIGRHSIVQLQGRSTRLSFFAICSRYTPPWLNSILQ